MTLDIVVSAHMNPNYLNIIHVQKARGKIVEPFLNEDGVNSSGEGEIHVCHIV